MLVSIPSMSSVIRTVGECMYFKVQQLQTLHISCYAKIDMKNEDFNHHEIVKSFFLIRRPTRLKNVKSRVLRLSLTRADNSAVHINSPDFDGCYRTHKEKSLSASTWPVNTKSTVQLSVLRRFRPTECVYGMYDGQRRRGENCFICCWS